jgi:hypothetical protein
VVSIWIHSQRVSLELEFISVRLTSDGYLFETRSWILSCYYFFVCIALTNRSIRSTGVILRTFDKTRNVPIEG